MDASAVPRLVGWMRQTSLDATGPERHKPPYINDSGRAWGSRVSVFLQLRGGNALSADFENCAQIPGGIANQEKSRNSRCGIGFFSLLTGRHDSDPPSLELPMRIPLRLLATCTALLFPGALALAGTLHVPGDYSDLQQAIYAAQPGDNVVIHGGSHTMITIDKPLHLIGSPIATIKNDIPNPMTGPGPNITLAGPGSGRVSLSRIVLTATHSGSIYSHAERRITGGGFSELHIMDCTIDAPEIMNPTGIDPNPQPAVAVGVAYILVNRSTISGGRATTDGSYPFYPQLPVDSEAAVRSPGATVAVFDSVLRGGNGPNLSYSGACPPNVDAEGGGGAGIVASKVLHTNSTIAGGLGQDAYCGSQQVGTTSDGPAFVANEVVALDNKLSAGQPLVMGASFTLQYVTASNPSVLIFGLPSPPLNVPGHGALFIQPQSMALFGIPSGFQSIPFNISNSPAVLGVEVALQVHDPAFGLTRPYIGAHVP